VEVPQSWNRYHYVLNRPLVLTDPKGLDWWYKKDAAITTPIWVRENINPGTGYGRWTTVNEYVYKSDTTGRWNVLDPFSNRSQIFDNESDARDQAEKWYQGGLTPQQHAFVDQTAEQTAAHGEALVALELAAVGSGLAIMNAPLVGAAAVGEGILIGQGVGIIPIPGEGTSSPVAAGTIDPNTGERVGRFIADANGNVMIEPEGGSTVPAGRGGADTHTLYPNGSNYQRLNPNGHPSNPTPHGHGHLPGTGPNIRGQGESISPNGRVVPFTSPAAHWPINPRRP
jgi:hypothetical protein